MRIDFDFPATQGSWARTWPQSPELGDSARRFQSVLRHGACNNTVVAQGFIDLTTHLQLVKQHGQLPSHGNNRSFLGIASSSLGEFQSPSPQITAGADLPLSDMGQRDQCSHAFDYFQQRNLGMDSCGDLFGPPVILGNPLAQ